LHGQNLTEKSFPMRRVISISVLLLLPEIALAGAIPLRTTIGSFPIAPKSVTHIELTRVDFRPGQEMPEHLHPVPVVCFVTKGSFVVSIGATPIRHVGVGQTTLEPSNTVVHYFRNASAKDPAQLNCALLAGPDDKVLSVMLNRHSK
jgi:quercetin dioxygenase-like cupin family protein